MLITDYTFTEVETPDAPQRVVSLVPSITETAFALEAGALLVGRTRYCIAPEQARAIPHVGGTKDPDVAKIIALKPDLVLANKEENRREDILRLREHLPVYVDYTTTVEEALSLVDILGRLLDRQTQTEPLVRRGVRALAQARDRAEQLEQANALRVKPRSQARPRVLAFIWRDPWMAVGRETYAGDMMETLGGDHLLKNHAERYPVLEPAQVAELRPDILLFPDEPFPFKDKDLDYWREALPHLPAVREDRLRLCDGQDLVWLGARTVDALGRLAALCGW